MNPARDVEALAPPFVCFPGAEGEFLGPGLALAALARSMGPAFPFYGVSLGDLPPSRDMAELIPAVADQFLPDLRAVLPRGPYHLGGYSRGGLLALEVARRLVLEGESVALLALFDVYGPNYPRRRGDAEWLLAHVVNLPNRSAHETLRRAADKLRAKLRRRTDRPSQLLEPGAAERHSSKGYLQSLDRYPGRITLFRAAIQLTGVRLAYDDPTNGWKAVALGGVDVIRVPGEHRTLLEPPNVADMASALRACLGGRPTPNTA